MQPSYYYRTALRAAYAAAKAPQTVDDVLRFASRPKHGKARAKNTAGQRAVDLTKYSSKLGDNLDVEQLKLMKSEHLKKLGMVAQDRKRLLKYTEKLRKGFVHDHDERRGAHLWKGWIEPTAP